MTGRPARTVAIVITVAMSLFICGASFAMPDVNDGVLALGDTGEKVEELQTELLSLGLYAGDITGIFDEETQTAVALLQVVIGVAPDGIYGAATAEAYDIACENGYNNAVPEWPEIEEPETDEEDTEDVMVPNDGETNEPAVPEDSTNALLPLSGLIIGIDPGHQLYGDNELEAVAPGSLRTKACMSDGAVGCRSGMPEYQIDLMIALKLRDMLTAYGASVYMTRTVNEVSLSNIERAIMMNQAGVDVWIRLHCDEASSAKPNGARILVPVVTVSGLNAISSVSAELAECVLNSFCETTGACKLGIEPVLNQTGFNWSTRPVFTIEMGYLSNPKEDTLLSRDSYQTACAEGICNGFLTYFCSVK